MVHKESALRPSLTDSKTPEEKYDEEMPLLAPMNLVALKQGGIRYLSMPLHLPSRSWKQGNWATTAPPLYDEGMVSSSRTQ